MKQPNWKTPLILSAVLLGFGTFAYWLQYSHKPKKEKADIQTKKPISLASEDTQIGMIRLKGANGLIELKCESIAEKTCSQGKNGKWVITNPPGPDHETLIADSGVVRDFINTVANAVSVETIDLSEESEEKRKSLFDQYGLSPEKRVKLDTQFIELVTSNEKGVAENRLAAWFGEEHPIGDKTFVGSSVNGTMNDKTVFLIANYFKTNNLGKTSTYFRDKEILNFDPASVTEITARLSAEKSNGGKLLLKKENSLWKVNGFESTQEQVENLLSGFTAARAKEFVDEGFLKGLKPIVNYQIKTGQQTLSLELFEKSLPAKQMPGGKQKLPAEKRYYVKTSAKKGAFEVEALLRSQIDKRISAFRKNVIFTDAEKVTATTIKVEGPGYSVKPEFEYKNQKWFPKDPKQEWDVSIATKLMDLLAMTRVQDFVSPPPSGKELMKLAIGDSKNPNKLNLSFFTAKDKLYARNLNDKNNEAYLMEDSMKPTLPKSEKEWKIQTNKDKSAEQK